MEILAKAFEKHGNKCLEEYLLEGAENLRRDATAAPAKELGADAIVAQPKSLANQQTALVLRVLANALQKVGEQYQDKRLLDLAKEARQGAEDLAEPVRADERRDVY
jgi:hypothetical protein